MEKSNVYSITFFISGFILPILFMILARFMFDQSMRINQIDQLATILGLVCEVFAIFFGVLSWKNNISKFVVIADIILIIGLFALLFTAPSSPSHVEPMVNPSIQTPSSVTPK